MRLLLKSPLSLGLALAGLFSAACASTPEPAPPPPPPPRRAAPPPPPPPPPPVLAVPDIRSVETERVPKNVTYALTQKLRSELKEPRQTDLAMTATAAGDAVPCITEPCQLEMARSRQVPKLLRARIVQYADSCVVLGILYDSTSGRSEWAFTSAVACESPALEGAVIGLATAFRGRAEPLAAGPIFGVVPLQHDLTDLAWASESFAEYLTTLLAEGGHTVIPASLVGAPLDGQKVEPYKACPDDRCAKKLATTASAEKVVRVKIMKQKKACALTGTIVDAGSAPNGATANAKATECGAAEIAQAIRTIAEALNK